jgi:hypothetical protein
VGGTPAWGLGRELTTPPHRTKCLLRNITHSLGRAVVNVVMNLQVLALRSEIEKMKWAGYIECMAVVRNANVI